MMEEEDLEGISTTNSISRAVLLYRYHSHKVHSSVLSRPSLNHSTTSTYVVLTVCSPSPLKTVKTPPPGASADKNQRPGKSLPAISSPPFLRTSSCTRFLISTGGWYY